MMPRPYVDRLYVNEAQTELTVVFNEAMILYVGWVKEDFNIYITGFQEPYEISWSLRDSNVLLVNGSTNFIFDINIKDQMLGYDYETFHVQFLNDEFFRAQATTLKLLNWTIHTDVTYQYASKQENQCGMQFVPYIFWTAFALMVCVVLYYCYKYMHSMTPLWLVIYSFQILHLHCCMYLFIPT